MSPAGDADYFSSPTKFREMMQSWQGWWVGVPWGFVKSESPVKLLEMRQVWRADKSRQDLSTRNVCWPVAA